LMRLLAVSRWLSSALRSRHTGRSRNARVSVGLGQRGRALCGAQAGISAFPSTGLMAVSGYDFQPFEAPSVSSIYWCHCYSIRLFSSWVLSGYLVCLVGQILLERRHLCMQGQAALLEPAHAEGTRGEGQCTEII
jgi:hypothetical protein